MAKSSKKDKQNTSQPIDALLARKQLEADKRDRAASFQAWVAEGQKKFRCGLVPVMVFKGTRYSTSVEVEAYD